MNILRTAAIVLLTATSMMAAAQSNRVSKPKPPHSAATQQNVAMIPAVKQLFDRARNGDASAQNELGVCYMKGSGVQKNDTLAYKWFTKSAAQKYPNGILNMAYCLRHGFGVKADSIKARDLYINAAGQGKDSVLSILDNASKKDVFMARTLAYAYANSKGGLKRNPAAVKTYLKRAIDLGDKSAYSPYAEYCFRTRDHVSAQKAYGEAYKNGDEKAAYWYGRYLINGEGGAPNPTEGYRLVYPFAMQGQRGAMELIGLCLLEGNGVETNPSEAVKWLEKAALKGSPQAQWNLALCNASGSGTERNMLRAFFWMNREAMHSSENLFKDFVDPAKGNADKYPLYFLYMQGLKALKDSNFTTAQKVAKDLVKQKAEKEGKILEGLSLLSLANPKRNVKKGYKLIAPYIDNDALVLFIIDHLQLEGALEGLDKTQKRNVVADLERLGKSGFGPAYSLLGEIYLSGKEGVQANDQRAIAFWTKAQELDGLSFEAAQTLAQCYEEGLGGLKKDAEKARRLRNSYRANQLDTLLALIPEYSGKTGNKIFGIF